MVGGGVGYLVGGDGSLTVAFAASGDTNLDGVVDILDAGGLMASGAYDDGSAAGWSQGDFNYDGLVDVLDVIEMLGADLYDQGSYLPAAPAAAAPLPEDARSLSAAEAVFAALALDGEAGGTAKKKAALPAT